MVGNLGKLVRKCGFEKYISFSSDIYPSIYQTNNNLAVAIRHKLYAPTRPQQSTQNLYVKRQDNKFDLMVLQ